MHNQGHAMMNGKANQNPLQMNNMGPMNGMNYNANRQYQQHNANHPQVNSTIACTKWTLTNTIFTFPNRFQQMHPMNNPAMGMNNMNAIAQMNEMTQMNPMSKMQGMANG